MAGDFTYRVNDQECRLKLKALVAGNMPELQKICGQYMVGSVQRTFRAQGCPPGSWKPLAAWTRQGAQSAISYRVHENGHMVINRGDSSRGKAGRAGKQILIESKRLMNSVFWEVNGNVVLIGSNLKYARIHQMGGHAGRRAPGPGNRRLAGPLLEGRRLVGRERRRRIGPFRRPYIPARPYLVFRPGDPQGMQNAIDRFLVAKANDLGLPEQESK